jgi:hypothetical protein
MAGGLIRLGYPGFVKHFAGAGRLGRGKLGLFWLWVGLTGEKLALIGFVSWFVVHGYLFVVHCLYRTYAHLGMQEIGFVLHSLVEW